MIKVYQFCGGKSATFAWFFCLATVCLEATGHLTANFIAAIGVIQTLIVTRAISQDRMPRGPEEK